MHSTDHTPVTAQLIEDFFVEKLNFQKKSEIPTYKYPEERDEEYYDEEDDEGDDLEMDQQQRAYMAFLEEK